MSYTSSYAKLPKMDPFRKRIPDYTDLAYREAVSKLKYLLAESYTPITVHKYTTGTHIPTYRAESQSDQCYAVEPRRTLSVAAPKRPETTGQPPPPELMSFIDRQEEYIEQLEKESQFCRIQNVLYGSIQQEELANMMVKVKDVIAENETLHRQRKEALLKSVFDTEEDDEEDTEVEDKTGTINKRVAKHKPLSGPNIMFESRISELEAQLTQCKMELRKAQDEASAIKTRSSSDNVLIPTDSSKQIDDLQRERNELNETVNNLQALVAQLREKEANATQKVKRSLDVVDQAQFEKNQLEIEVRRLKTELERLNEKQRESLQEATRRVNEAERRYAAQVERLNSDLANQWDTNNRLNLDLDRAKRTEQELRRELAQRNTTIEELKKELTTKTSSLQSEALSAGAERESLESELAAAKLAVERCERSARQEAARLQAEVTSLRQRLDRADTDLLHSRKENIRLTDNIAMLEKELSLAKLAKDSKESGQLRDNKRDEELTSMIRDIDAKHVQSVAELEGMIQSQTQLMEKLKDECRTLTQRLEDSSSRHKTDEASWVAESSDLVRELNEVQACNKELHGIFQNYLQNHSPVPSNQMMEWWEIMKVTEESMGELKM